VASRCLTTSWRRSRPTRRPTTSAPGFFTREDGKQLDSDALSHRTGKVFKEAGLPDLKDAYVMCHTFASLMDAKDVPHKVIADMMGHTSLAMFNAVYGHRLRPEVTEVDVNALFKKRNPA
jgi:integrase